MVGTAEVGFGWCHAHNAQEVPEAAWRSGSLAVEQVCWRAAFTSSALALDCDIQPMISEPVMEMHRQARGEPAPGEGWHVIIDFSDGVTLWARSVVDRRVIPFTDDEAEKIRAAHLEAGLPLEEE